MPTYVISDQNDRDKSHNRNPDTSFKSCICLLLIFITLCIILILAATFLKKSHEPQVEEDFQVEYLENYQVKNRSSLIEKFVESTTRKLYDPETTPNLPRNKITTTTTENGGSLYFTSQPSTTNEDDDLETSLSVITLPTTLNIEQEIPNATTARFIIHSTEITVQEDRLTEKISSTAEIESLTTTENIELLTTETIEQSSMTMNEFTSETNFEPTTLPTENQKIIQTQSTTTTQIPTTSQILTTSTTRRISSTPEREKQPTPQALQTLRQTCATNGCKAFASNMLYLIDPGQDPCEDFYGFACGGPEGISLNKDIRGIAREQQVADVIFMEVAKMEVENRSKCVQEMIKYYNVCMKDGFDSRYEERLKSVRNLMNEMKVHQFVVPVETDGSVDLTVLFEKMIVFQVLPIFDVNVGLGLETGSKFQLELTPPSLFASSSIFLDEDVHTSNSQLPPVTSAQMLLLRRRCFADLEERIGKIYGPDIFSIPGSNMSRYEGRQERLECMSRYRAGTFMDSVMHSSELLLQIPDGVNSIALEKEVREDLANILDNIDKLFIHSDSAIANATAKSVFELEVEFPCIKWVELLSKLTSKTFSQNTWVYLKHSELLSKMFKYLRKLPAYKVYNAFLALFSTDLYLNLVELQARSTSTKAECQIETISLFNHVSSALYVKSIKLSEQEAMDEHFDDIFNQLKRNLTASLQEAQWMDERSKTSCVSVLDQLSVYLINDESLLENDEIDKLYKTVNISENHQKNWIHMVSLKRKLTFQIYSKEFSVQFINGFFLNSYDIQPKSFFSESLIAIPMGILDVYNPIGLPRFLAMAKIGIHIALELGKRFDPVGITQGLSLSKSSKYAYDDSISFSNAQFAQNMQRFIHKNEYYYKIKSELSLNARFAESMAFRIVLDAFGNYQELLSLPWLDESYSNEQIYIISTIQEFCSKRSYAQYLYEMFESSVLPPALRVENMVTNTVPFATAFKCPSGAKMNSFLKYQFPYYEAIESADYRSEEYGTL